MRERDPDKLSLFALATYGGIGPVRIREILSSLKEAKVSWKEILGLSPSTRRSRLGLDSALHGILDRLPSLYDKAAVLASDLRKRDIFWMEEGDQSYPRRLIHFMRRGAPPLIFCKGELSLLNSPYFLGIIGTREPTDKGSDTARRMAEEAARRGAVVVSGGARGIDTCVHKAALGCGHTIIILPYGLDYERRLGLLSRYFQKRNHLILSEFPPFERGNTSTPILRNRTVAALSDALLVIETGTRGGSLHTVRFAREYGKPILAVDFSPLPNPQGNASLLATVADAIPCFTSGRESHWELVFQALEKGKALINAKGAVQNLLF